MTLNRKNICNDNYNFSKHFELSETNSNNNSFPLMSLDKKTNPKRNMDSSVSLNQLDEFQNKKNLLKITSSEELGKISKYGELPDCLKNTLITGELTVDENGNLIISQDIQSVFEYFLSAQSEESLETIVSRIEEYIDLTLPHKASLEALEILYSYLSYKKSLERVDPDNYKEASRNEMVNVLKDAIQKRYDSRRKYLKPEIIEAFFSKDEQYDEFTISRMELENNPEISYKEKQQILKQMEELLPEDIKERRSKFEQEQVMNTKIEEIKEQGEDNKKIYDLRATVYGHDAAKRLMDYDIKQNEFNKRFNEYLAFKKKIKNSSKLDDEKKQMEIEYFEKDNFNDIEIRKIKIMERLHSEKKNNA